MFNESVVLPNVSEFTSDFLFENADTCMYQLSKTNYKLNLQCLQDRGVELLNVKMYHSSLLILAWVFLITPSIKWFCLRAYESEDREVWKEAYKTVGDYIFVTDYVAIASFCFFCVFTYHFGL